MKGETSSDTSVARFELDCEPDAEDVVLEAVPELPGGVPGGFIAV